MGHLHRILVATDFSQASMPALKEAIDVAKRDGAELIIAHAYEPPSPFSLEGYVVPGAYEKSDQSLRAGAEKGLEPLVREATEKGVASQALVLRGVAHQAITAAAEAESADLLVLGTHGRTGLSRMLLGSVAARVIATAPCPVLTVRAA